MTIISNWQNIAKNDFEDGVFSDWIQATKAHSHFAVKN